MIDPYAQDIAAIAEAETPMETVIENYDRWCAFMERVKELDKLAKGAMKSWIDANGPIDTGRLVYWVGHPKETQNVDKDGAIAALVKSMMGRFIELLDQGDMESALVEFITEFLRDFVCSDPLKSGSVKKQLGAAADAFFKVVVKDKLESGESLPKKLQSVDKAFLK